jgi:hypothetical protein
MKSYPSNIDLQNYHFENSLDAAPIESLYLHTSTIFHYYKPEGAWSEINGIRFQCNIFNQAPSYHKLPNFHQEFGTNCKFQWGTYSEGSRQLAYAIVRFITNSEELAKLIYKQFLYRYVMLWRGGFSFSFYEIQRMVLKILKIMG